MRMRIGNEWIAALLLCGVCGSVFAQQVYRVGNTALKVENTGEWTVYYRNELAVKDFRIVGKFRDDSRIRTDERGAVRATVRETDESDRMVFDFGHKTDKRGKYSVEIAVDSVTIEPRITDPVKQGTILFFMPNSFFGRLLARCDDDPVEYPVSEDASFRLQGRGGASTFSFARKLHFKMIQKNREMNFLLKDWSLSAIMFQDYRGGSSIGAYRMAVGIVDKPVTGRLTIQFDGQADAEFTPIRLGAAANIDLADEVARDGKGGWNDGGPENSLLNFPTGTNYFLGVPFTIPDPKNRSEKAGIHIYAKKHAEAYPREVSIPVNQKAAAFYFLHATAFTPRRKQLDIAAYTLSFADGSTARQTIRAGRDVFEWYRLGNNKSEGCLPAWTGVIGNGVNVGIGLYKLRNPHPEKEVTHLALTSLGTPVVLGVLGVTASSRDIEITRNMLQPAIAQLPRLSVSSTYGHGTARRRVIGPIEHMLTKKNNTVKILRISDKDGYHGVSQNANVVAYLDHRAYDETGGKTPFRKHFELTDSDFRNMRDIVANGGGLVLSAPPEELKELADMLPVDPPADGCHVHSTVASQELVLIGKVDDGHPVTAGVRWDEVRPLAYYFPCRAKKDATVIARFNTGEPAVVVGSYRKGRVVFAAITPNSGAVLGKGAGFYGQYYDMPLFYLKAFYWASGNDKFADNLAHRVPCHKLRHRYTEKAAELAMVVGDLVALGGYHKAPAARIAKLTSEWENLDKALSSADDLLLSWQCKKAFGAYQSLLKRTSAFEADLTAAIADLSRQGPFKAVKVASGAPLKIGAHGFPNTAYLYDPQHWPARKWVFEHWIKKFLAAGFNNSAHAFSGLNTFVKYGADPTTVEPSDFKLDWFDDFFKACAKHGFTSYVYLDDQPHGRNFVGWHGKYINDKNYFSQGCRIMGQMNKKLGYSEKWYGKIYATTTFDPVAVKRRRQALRIVAAHFKDMPAVVGFQNMNEGGPEVRYIEDLDIKAFREHLAKSFKTVNKMNALLGTSYQDFASVSPPRPKEMKALKPGPNPKRGVWYEWASFVRNHYAEYFQGDCRAIRDGAPNKEMMDRTTPNSTVSPHHGVLSQMEYEKFLKNYTTTGIHLSSNMACDFMSGFAKGKRLGLSEWYNLWGDTYNGGIVARPEVLGRYQLLTVDTEKRLSAFVRMNLWSRLSRGVRVVQNHVLASLPYNTKATTYEHSLTQSDGYFKRHAYSQTKVAAAFRKMAGVLDAATPASQIAILYSHATVIHSYGSEVSLALGRMHDEIGTIYSMFMKKFQRQVDWIPPGADISGYKVIICPYTLFLTDEVKTRLLTYLRNGGVVVATGPVGLYDRWGKSDLSFLRDALGSAIKVTPLSKNESYVELSGGKAGTSIYCSVALEDLPSSARTTEYSNGKAAWFSAAVGKGTLVVSGFPAKGSAAAEQFLRQALAFIDPETEVSHPMVNTFKCRIGNRHILYVINMKNGKTKTTVQLPAKNAHVTDLRLGVAFNVEGQFDAEFAEMGCRVYEWSAR